MAAAPWTVGAALTGAAALLRGESSSPPLDAELLLAHVLKQPRVSLLARRGEAVPPRAQRAFATLVRRRREGRPLPYLTGTTEFAGRRFVVTPAALIPRPESEDLVPEALRLLDRTAELRPRLTDLGTGSGVLAVTIAATAPRARVVATDSSAAALVLARRNARRHRVFRRITFLVSDLLTEIPPELLPQVIVANLPYVPSDELARAGDSRDTRGLAFEPAQALDGGPDGLFVIRRFFAQLARRSGVKRTLRSLVLEHSPAQQRKITELAYDTLPKFRPRAVTPFVTSWTQT